MPNRSSTDPAASAPPASTESARDRPPTTVAAAPAAVSALAARSSIPGRFSCSGSASIPSRRCITSEEASSTPAPSTAIRRAAPACRVGVAIIASPPAAQAPLPANTNGSSRYASCQTGTAVSAISAEV